MEENRGLALSDVSASCFVLSKLNSGKQHHCHFGNAPSLYLRILLNGFLHWRSFVFRVIFEEESFIIYQEFFNLVDVSLCLQWSSNEIEELIPQSTSQKDLLDCDVVQIDFHSLNQSLNPVNRVVAKMSFSNRIHSLPKEADGDVKGIPLEMGSNLELSRMRFINNMPVNFPLVTNCSAKGKSIDSTTQYKYLEVFILNSFFKITTEMHDGFHDFAALRGILMLLSNGMFSRAPYLQLLLSHPQYVHTIH
ncbi:hypothetical protein CFP56_040672 [Quercus suber]|uniref:Uncharacterized protein n=1 Tax=Quercus suber TaxID=58331 RepID=A0AAW0IXN9_QUESU